MYPISTLITTAIIIFISMLCQATFGSGSAMIAMPLLVLFIPLKTATPLVGVTSMITSLIIVGKDWRQIDWRSTWQLMLAAVLGLPIGLYLLLHVPESTVKMLLGLTLILFGLYSMLPVKLPEMSRPYLVILFGLSAGILGSAYNITAPAVILYGAIKRWQAKSLRASLSGFSLPIGVMIVIGHLSAGLWTIPAAVLLLVSLPSIALAIYLGNILNKILDPRRFRISLNIFILIVGFLLVITSL